MEDKNVKIRADFLEQAAKRARIKAEADQKARAVEEARKEQERLEQLAKCQTDLEKTREKFNTVNAFYPIALCATFVIGFILGLTLAVSQLLRFHGPTVTFFETIAAYIIYSIVGLAFGAGFAWLVFDWYRTTVKECRQRIRAIKNKIKALTPEEPVPEEPIPEESTTEESTPEELTSNQSASETSQNQTDVN